MPRDPRALILDAHAAGRLIEHFVRDRSLADYQADPMLRSAVERQFEIIGEALTQLARMNPELAERIPDRRRIIDFRNVLAHAYAIVDPTLVWQATQENLPPLLAVLTDLIEEEERSQRPV